MTIRVANAPCSWGVLEFELEGKAAGHEQVLAEMATAGYRGTELGDWGFMPTEPEALRKVLGRHDLPVLGAFVPCYLRDASAHAQGVEVAVKTARLLASQNPDAFIVLADENGKDSVRTQNTGRITPAMGLDESSWVAFARGAERVAQAVKDETGLRTVFHFHCAGYVETPTEIRELVRRTSPDLLGLCFDTGHYTFGGGDPVAGIREHADRIWHVHFKDCDPGIAQRAKVENLDYFGAVKAGVFCELGKGSVDFRAVLQTLQAKGYDGWIVVEQDVLPGMGSPLESATRNRQFLAGLGL